MVNCSSHGPSSVAAPSRRSAACSVPEPRRMPTAEGGQRRVDGRRASVARWGLSLLIAALAGCQRDDIKVYRVAKEDPPAETTRRAKEDAPAQQPLPAGWQELAP